MRVNLTPPSLVSWLETCGAHSNGCCWAKLPFGEESLSFRPTFVTGENGPCPFLTASLRLSCDWGKSWQNLSGYVLVTYRQISSMETS